MIIQRGDLYILPVKIKMDNTVITPDNISDVRIQVADDLKEYSKRELSFNTVTNEWEYPLTWDITVDYYKLTVPIQVGVKDNDDIYLSKTDNIMLGDSIIKKEW